MHPAFADLVRHALDVGLKVQVYSNLYLVKVDHWELFEEPGVSLATSYYSDITAEHDKVTGRKGSHDNTRSNIIEALRRGVHVQVGIIDVLDGQRVEQASEELRALGVTAIRTDRVRGVGNAAKTLPSTSELCGSCGSRIAAIGPDGQVWPCVMSRFLHPAGNVKSQSLADVLGGSAMAALVSAIPSARGACVPDSCTPNEDSCQPSPGLDPCVPKDSPCGPGKPACVPKFSNYLEVL